MRIIRFSFVWMLALPIGCGGLDEDEVARLQQMELTAAAVPASPTNQFADDPAAAELGHSLFFDEAMSATGDVSCATCHDPAEGWSDPKPVSKGVEDREGHRHSMPILGAALQRFQFWDGRADSLWSQPLKAIENEVEMDFGRVEVARFVADRYRQPYEQVFGPLPDVGALPPKGRPGTPEWDALTDTQRASVDRVFSNVGKALEAYQRLLLCVDTRFDRWARGEVTFSGEEEDGAAEFVDEGCINCHAGRGFSDGKFHNIGIGSGTSDPDEASSAARAILEADPFNGAGVFSDDPIAGAATMDAIAAAARLGAFRTPSLRGVTQRRFFGHRGHREQLDDFLDDVYDRPRMQPSAVGELDDDVRRVELEGERDMIAFLRTLECPTLPAALLQP